MRALEKISVLTIALTVLVLSSSTLQAKETEKEKPTSKEKDPTGLKLFLEPGVGLAFGNFRQDRTNIALGSDYEATSALGVAFPIKVGLRTPEILGGLDFNGGPLTYRPNDGRVGTSGWLYLGFLAGFEFSDFPIQFWGGFSPMARYQIANDPGTTRLYKGSAWKVGAGYRFRLFTSEGTMLRLNVEYAKFNLGSAKGLDGTQTEFDLPKTQGNPEITYAVPTMHLWIISLSIPISFYPDL